MLRCIRQWGSVVEGIMPNSLWGSMTEGRIGSMIPDKEIYEQKLRPLPVVFHWPCSCLFPLDKARNKEAKRTKRQLQSDHIFYKLLKKWKQRAAIIELTDLLQREREREREGERERERYGERKREREMRLKLCCFVLCRPIPLFCCRKQMFSHPEINWNYGNKLSKRNPPATVLQGLSVSWANTTNERFLPVWTCGSSDSAGVCFAVESPSSWLTRRVSCQSPNVGKMFSFSLLGLIYLFWRI